MCLQTDKIHNMFADRFQIELHQTSPKQNYFYNFSVFSHKSSTDSYINISLSKNKRFSTDSEYNDLFNMFI